MTDFIRYIVKFACISLGLFAILLLLAAGLLLFVPDILLSVLYYAVIVACVIAAIWIILSLLWGLFLKK